MAKQSNTYIEKLAGTIRRTLERKTCYEYLLIPYFTSRYHADRPQFRRNLVQHSTLVNGDELEKKLTQTLRDIEQSTNINFKSDRGSEREKHFLKIVDALDVTDISQRKSGCFSVFLGGIKEFIGILNKKHVTNLHDLPRLVPQYTNTPLYTVPSLTQLALKTMESNPQTKTELEKLKEDNPHLVQHFYDTDSRHFQKQIVQSREENRVQIR